MMNSLPDLLQKALTKKCKHFSFTAITNQKLSRLLQKAVTVHANLPTTVSTKETLELNVSCVLVIIFTVSNTHGSLLSSSGELFISRSAGKVGLFGGKKTNRQIAIKKITSFLAQNYIAFGFLNRPISLQLRNVTRFKKYVIKVVKKFFLIGSIKIFDGLPYNGCRKKKLRRKKIVRQIQR